MPKNRHIAVCPDMAVCLDFYSTIAENPNSDYVIFRCLEELLEQGCLQDTYTRVTLIVGYLKILLDSESDLFLDALDAVADCYRKNPNIFKVIFIERLRTSKSFAILTLFCTRFQTIDDTFPRHFILENTFMYKKFLRGYGFRLVGYGGNKFYNLGIPSDAVTTKPKTMNFNTGEIMKMSMANKYSLFLNKEGEAYGCGSTAQGQLGYSSSQIVVTPTLIKFPNPEKRKIIDLVALEHFSVFVTHQSVFICGNLQHFDSNASTTKSVHRFNILKNEDPCNPVIIAGEACICIYANEFVFLYGSCCDKVFTSFTRFHLETLPLEFTEYFLSKRFRRSTFSKTRASSGGRNPCFADDIFIKSHGIQSNCRMASISYSDNLSYEFLFFIPRAHMHDSLGPSVENVYEPLQMQLASGFNFNCYAVIHGMFARLRIFQFEIKDGGEIILLGHAYRLRWANKTTTQTPCLYRGKISVFEKAAFDCEFTHRFRSKVEQELSEKVYVFHLEEIPNSYGASFFCASPDLDNVVWKYEGNPIHSDNIIQHLVWRSLNLHCLNNRRLESGLEPLQHDIEIRYLKGPQMKTFCVTTETLGYRIPALLRFVHNGILDLNEVKDALQLPKKIWQIMFDFIKGRSHTSLIRCDGKQSFEDDQDEKIHIESLDLCLEPTFIGLTRIYKSKTDDWEAETDCVLHTSDEFEILVNQKFLEAHSNYFGLAFHYTMDNLRVLKVDYPKDTVQKFLKILKYPDLLLDIPTEEIYALLDFADNYLFETFLEDCLDALFRRATDFDVMNLFVLFFEFPTYKQRIVSLFVDRLDLVCSWVASAAAPIELLKAMEIHMHSYAPEKVIMNNPLLIHANFSETTLFSPLCGYSKKVVRSILLGSNKSPTFKNELEESLEYLKNFEDNALSRNSGSPFFTFDTVHSMNRLREAMIASYSKYDNAAKPASRRRKKHKISETSESDMDFSTTKIESTTDFLTDIQNHSENVVDSLKTLDLHTVTNPTVRTERSILPVSRVDAVNPLKGSTPKIKKPKLLPIGKGKKANHLLGEEQHSHAAPWANTSSLSVDSFPSFSEIQAQERREEENRPSPQTHRGHNKQHAWNLPSTSQQQPGTFNQILQEEQQLHDRRNQKCSRPLRYIEIEELAVQELTELYVFNVGDEAIVTIEFETSSSEQPVWVPNINRRF